MGFGTGGAEGGGGDDELFPMIGRALAVVCCVVPTEKDIFRLLLLQLQAAGSGSSRKKLGSALGVRCLGFTEVTTVTTRGV